VFQRLYIVEHESADKVKIQVKRAISISLDLLVN